MIQVETVSTRTDEDGDVILTLTESEHRWPSAKPDTPTRIGMSRALAVELHTQLGIVLAMLAAAAPSQVGDAS
jgi:hypothetical protein